MAGAHYTGPLAITGALTVSTTATITGAVTLGATLGVTGNATVGGTLTISGNKACTVGGTCGVTGNTTLSGTLGVTGNTSLGGNLSVTGASTLSGTLTVDSLKITGVRIISVPLLCVKNATNYTSVVTVNRATTITAGSITFYTKPSSTLGAVTFALSNRDASAPATDNLLSTDTIDLEGLTSLVQTDLTLTGTAGDLVLANGDMVFATIISDNNDMTGGVGGVLTLECTW